MGPSFSTLNRSDGVRGFPFLYQLTEGSSSDSSHDRTHFPCSKVSVNAAKDVTKWARTSVTVTKALHSALPCSLMASHLYVPK